MCCSESLTTYYIVEKKKDGVYLLDESVNKLLFVNSNFDLVKEKYFSLQKEYSSSLEKLFFFSKNKNERFLTVINNHI